MQIASFVMDEMAEMFDRIDADGDRSISFAEFSRLMRNIDHSRSNEDLRKDFRLIDLDQDDQVSFDEFCTWIRR
jgi:Ca2+-binding EF-hand superfamily protein